MAMPRGTGFQPVCAASKPVENVSKLPHSKGAAAHPLPFDSPSPTCIVFAHGPLSLPLRVARRAIKQGAANTFCKIEWQ